MDMIHKFQFGDIISADFDLYVLDKPNRGFSITRDFESVNVPGRNGDLHIDHGRYNNIEITYQCAVMHDADYKLTTLNTALASMIGYHRLEDSIDPSVYRIGNYVDGMEVMPGKTRDAARVDITFNCKPQLFLKIGEIPMVYTQNGQIYNLERFASKPLIRVYGNGTVTVGETTLTWTGSSSYVDIDCDIQDCFYMGSNMNPYVEMNRTNFPELPPGTTNITLGSGVTRVEITPRWWRV